MPSTHDAIHGLTQHDEEEAKVLDSDCMRRLMYVRQLATTYLVRPGATHCRNEHSQGVMHLAGRIFDSITQAEHLSTELARTLVPKATELRYWRRVVRLAALLHDAGHLPFSHAAERELLPSKWDHERLSDLLIHAEEMQSLLRELGVKAQDVAKVALGPGKFGPDRHRSEDFTPWEAILAEIIVSNAFGADRMDYILRDAHHAGARVLIDCDLLIDSLRILPKIGSEVPTLGVVQEGLGAVEGLVTARYLLYKEVYFNPMRKAYDFHLQEFLKSWLPQGRFATTVNEHLTLTDNEVLVAIASAARDPQHPGHAHARRLWNRVPFVPVYRRNPDDVQVNPRAGQILAKALAGQFGKQSVHYFIYEEEIPSFAFPVQLHDSRCTSCRELSPVLQRPPTVQVEMVLIAPEHFTSATAWLRDNREQAIAKRKGRKP